MIKLLQGDCLELMKNIPDGSVDMILCDLPYGVTACKWDNVIPFEPLWEQYNRIIKDNGAICLFGTEPFSSHLRLSNIKNYKYDWVWIKPQVTNIGKSHRQPLRCNENISVFYKKQPFYDYKGEKLEKPYTHTLPIHNGGSSALSVKRNLTKNGDRIYKTYTHKTKTNVLEFTRNQKGSLHPTQKPVALLEYLIKTYTNEGDTVMDNCMGSGSTGIACKRLNRNFIGIELDKNYFEIAKSRIENKENTENKEGLEL